MGRKEFTSAFRITSMILFEVSYCHLRGNENAHFTTSADLFIRSKRDFSRCGQCQDDVLPENSLTKNFYKKWDYKHLQDLTDEEYEDMMKDYEELKSKYPYIENEGDRDIRFSQLVELSKQTKTVTESKKVESMDKDDLISQFKKFLEFNGYEEKDVDEDIINEFFTDVFYDVEDEKDIDASNEAEEEIRRKYLGESKKVEEVKLQEGNESKYKQKFINYCEGKVEDLGTMQVLEDEDEGEYTEYQIAMIEPEFEGTSPAYLLISEDDEGMLVCDEDGNIVSNGLGDEQTMMQEIKDMSFTNIDTNFYNMILEYWDNYDFDESSARDDVDREQREKIEKEFKCPKGFGYNVISRNGGADVEVYCNKYPDLKASTTTMKGDEYVQDYFDIDGLWQVSKVDNKGKWLNYEYVTGWQDAMKLLQDQYNQCKSGTAQTESKKITESEDKNQSELEHTINVWAIDEENLRFENPEDLAEVYYDALVDTGELEDLGYTEADREEVLGIIENVIYDVQDQVGDIFTIAENYNGNNDELEDDEWQQVYENAPEIFKSALRARADYMADSWGTVPDRVWDWLDRSVDEQIGFNGYDPAFIIDNVLVNGSYGDFDDFKDENETDEEFIAREEDNCLEIFPEERFIIYSI